MQFCHEIFRHSVEYLAFILNSVLCWQVKVLESSDICKQRRKKLDLLLRTNLMDLSLYTDKSSNSSCTYFWLLKFLHKSGSKEELVSNNETRLQEMELVSSIHRFTVKLMKFIHFLKNSEVHMNCFYKKYLFGWGAVMFLFLFCHLHHLNIRKFCGTKCMEKNPVATRTGSGTFDGA